MTGNAQRSFDGLAVDQHAGRFVGPFDIDSAEVDDLGGLDDENYWVVRTRTKSVQVADTKTGDLKRTNIYAVSEVTLIGDQVGAQLQAGATAQLNISMPGLQDLLDDTAAEAVEADA